jgi:hypothetical protein
VASSQAATTERAEPATSSGTRRRVAVVVGIVFTQGAGSPGRTVGLPLAAAAYVVVYWSPFVAGALLLVPVALLLRR